jgi:Ca2+-dependent lipid-binding protein
VFATPRVTLRPLIETFPCFSKIVVSLMEKPHVDFGLKLLGGDVMAVPGLYRIVQDIIKDQVANMYLWPKNLIIPVVDDVSAATKPVGMLHITIVKASNLRKKDILGKSDPYVKLYLGGATSFGKVTRTVKNSLNPEWNESFKLVVNNPETQSLELHMYDWDKVGAHEKMGIQVIPLKDLVPEETKSLTLDLVKNMDLNDPANHKQRGNITLELTYKPFKEEDMADINEDDEEEEAEKAPEGLPDGAGLLVVIIHEAEEVEGKHHTNPFVRIVFKGEEKRTKPIKKNRDPKWEQRFEWILEEPPTSDRMHVEVMSKSMGLNPLHQKESLGYVDINLGDVVNNKRINENYQLIDSKNGRIQVELQWKTG